MRLRTLGAAAAAVLAITALAGCRTNVGTAATVDGHRISESDVNDYIKPGGPDPAFIAQVQQSGQTLPSPRTFVLEFLLQEQVYEQTLAARHELPAENVLASYHDAAASVVFRTQLAGEDLDTAITQSFPKAGIAADFSSVYLRAAELEYALIKNHNISRLSDLVNLVRQANVHVTVSPRYGSWNTTQLALTAQIPTPSYLTVQPGANGAVANQPVG